MTSLLNLLAASTQFGVFDVIESLLVLGVVGWVFACSATTTAALASDEKSLLGRFSATPLRLGVTLVAAGLILHAVLSRPPSPRIPDEFSLLLQAQTFLLGRLANPTHALAEFFETPYVNQVPTYASIYFPGRSLPLVVGIALFNDPWSGIWITMIAFSLATAWMLRAWVSPRLALLGGLIVIIRFGVFNFWTNSYVGGAITALGGVLVTGAYERMRNKITLGHSVVFAFGVLILMLTRPYEGFLFCIPFIFVLGRRAVVSGMMDIKSRAKLILPTTMMAFVGFICLTGYDLATTGSLTVTPYELNRRDYAVAPAFLTGSSTVPQRLVPRYLHNFYLHDGDGYRRLQGRFGVLKIIYAKALTLVLFCVGPALLIPFANGLTQWRRLKAPVAGTGMMVGGYMLTSWDWAWYLSAALGIFILIIVVGLDQLHFMRWRSRVTGANLSRSLPLICAVMLIVPIVSPIAGLPMMFSGVRICCSNANTLGRVEVERSLLSIPGRHVVMVTFDFAQPARSIWIANAPDIDAARIIWANDLGFGRNKVLYDRYPDRRLWSVHLREGEKPRLVEMTRG